MYTIVHITSEREREREEGGGEKTCVAQIIYNKSPPLAKGSRYIYIPKISPAQNLIPSSLLSSSLHLEMLFFLFLFLSLLWENTTTTAVSPAKATTGSFQHSRSAAE